MNLNLNVHACGVTSCVAPSPPVAVDNDEEEDEEGILLTPAEDPVGVVVASDGTRHPMGTAASVNLLAAAVALAERHYGPQHPIVAAALCNYAAASVLLGGQDSRNDSRAAAARAVRIARAYNDHATLGPALRNAAAADGDLPDTESHRVLEEHGIGRAWNVYGGVFYALTDPLMCPCCAAASAVLPPPQTAPSPLTEPLPLPRGTEGDRGPPSPLTVAQSEKTVGPPTPLLVCHVSPVLHVSGRHGPPRGPLEPCDLLRDLVLCANRGTVHMQHSDGKSTLTMSHVGDVHKYLLSEMWPSLERFVQTYARFAAYLRAQGDTTRDRVSTAWTHPIHDIKVKQDALTGLLDAYYRKVFRSHQPKGPTQFDVSVGAPESLTPNAAVRHAFDEAVRVNTVLTFATAAVQEAFAEGRTVAGPWGPGRFPESVATLSRIAVQEALRLATATLATVGVAASDGSDDEAAECQVAAAALVANAVVYAAAVAEQKEPRSPLGGKDDDRDAKARHKWFVADGVHLKDMSCVERLSSGPRSKVFLVRHNRPSAARSDGSLTVKEITLCRGSGPDRSNTTPLDARESDRRVSRYCQLWEWLSQDPRAAMCLVCPTDVFFKSHKLKIITPYAPERSLDDAVVRGTTPTMAAPTVARALLQALAFLHEVGVVHGMLTLRDVIVLPNATVVLNDVGTGLLYGEGAAEEAVLNTARDLRAVAQAVACLHLRVPVAAMEGRLTAALLGPDCPPFLQAFVAACGVEGVTAAALLGHPFVDPPGAAGVQAHRIGR